MLILLSGLYLSDHSNPRRATLQTCKRLNQQLNPSSKIHKNHDIDGLKRLRREVEELVERVPPGACHDIQFDLQLAIKAIIKEPKARSQI